MKVTQNPSAKEVRILRDAEVLTYTGTTVETSFADAGAALDTAGYTSLAITLKNTGGANGLSWKIMASIDGVSYVEIVASANVAFGAIGTAYTTTQAPYRYYKVMVKDQVDLSHTTFSTSLIAK